MCDTLFVPASYTHSGYPLFAKNSDREPNEPQVLEFHTGTSNQAGVVRATYISLPQVAATYSVLISRPFHMWGAEMGVNGHRLAIGNEAVFTRIAFARTNTGLTGMDMLRLALERCANAPDALDLIIELNATYGQDACGGYRNRRFYYHNSFIIADPHQAFVLELAGPYWAWQRITAPRAISNRLSIGQHWDGIHPGAADFARKKGWAKPGDDFHFAQAFSAPFMTYMARGIERRAFCETGTCSGGVKLSDAFSMLRSHGAAQDFNPRYGKAGHVCMHASGLTSPSQTTASMVVELNPNEPISAWCTATAAPCLSLFKPVGLVAEINRLLMPTPGAQPDNSYWWRWEHFNRLALRNYEAAAKLVQPFQHSSEAAWQQAIASGLALEVVSNGAFQQSLDRLQQWTEFLLTTERGAYPGLTYHFYRKHIDRQVGW